MFVIEGLLVANVIQREPDLPPLWRRCDGLAVRPVPANVLI